MAVNGTPSPFVTLVSSDGFEFHVRRSAACVSGALRRMLDTQSARHPSVCLHDSDLYLRQL